MLRIGVFVNVANQISALSLKRKGHRVNYEKYLNFLVSSSDRLIMAIAYGTQVSSEAESFIYVLKKIGYITKFLPTTKLRQDLPNRNVEMTIDILKIVDRLDIIILGSNDPDLIPLIHELQLRGIEVLVVSPGIEHNEKQVDILNNDNLIEYIQDMRERSDEISRP